MHAALSTSSRVLVTQVPATAATLAAFARRAATAGYGVPLAYHPVAADVFGWSETTLFELHLADGTFGGGFVLARRVVMPLYRHVVATAPAFGALVPASCRADAVAALVDAVRGDARTLRLTVGLFDRTPERRLEIASLLARAGLVRREKPDAYEWTIAVPMADDATMLAGFGTSTRRNLRLVAKAPVRIEVVASAEYADRLNEIAAASLRRTGGVFVPRDWRRAIALSAQHPDRLRLVGVFRADLEAPRSPEALIAFAWGWMHGDRCEYNEAGSMRLPDFKAPLSHGLVWELMRWGRDHGAAWFDLGGVTTSSVSDNCDSLGGISEFKRGFGQEMVQVHEEWVLEATTLRAAIARTVRRCYLMARADRRRAVATPSGHSFAA